jgi:hypothetical protein
MPHKQSQIGVQIVGTRFLRFVIANLWRQVWTGDRWSDRRDDALLYADIPTVRRDVIALKRRLREAGSE